MSDQKEEKKKIKKTLTITKSLDLGTITLTNFHNELAHTCTSAGKQEQITASQST